MRHILPAVGIVLLAATSFSCVAPIKLEIPPAQEVRIEPGKLVVDGVERSVPFDTFYSLADGRLVPHVSGFRLEPIIGASLVGLEGSPWAGVRFLHVENVGLDFGFDRHNFTLGPDWLYHTIVIGPSVCFPYDLGDSHFGFKAGFLF